MKKAKLLIVLIFVTLSAKTQENQFSTETKLFTCSKIWHEVKANFPYFDRFHESYWDSLYASTIPKIIVSKNDFEFLEILDDFVNSLYEAHTIITFNHDYYNYKDEKTSKPDIFVNWFYDGYYVIVVSDLLESKIPLGSKILSLNNIEIEEYAKTEFSKTIHSKHKHVINHFSGWLLLSGEKGSKIKIKYKTLDNKILETELVRERAEKCNYKFLNQSSFLLELERENFVFKKDSNNICYLNLPGAISTSTIEFFESKIDSIRSSNGLIIDVRSSSGGSSYGDEIVKWISRKEEFQSFAALFRVDNSYYKALGGYTDTNIIKIVGGIPRHFEFQNFYKNSAFDTLFFKKKREKKFINVPVVIIVNPSVCSATEAFLLSFKNANAGKIIGQPTMGSCTQPLIVPIENVGFLKVATQKPIYPDGTFFNYIIPDIIINPTISGYIEGKDEIFEAAYKYLKTH